MIKLPEARHAVARYSTNGLVNLLRKTRVTPNALTLAGLAVSVVAAVVIAQGHLIAGALTVLLSAAFDLFDGPLARAKGQTSKFGALLDSTCDRMEEGVVLLGLLILYLGKDATWEPVLIYTTFVGSVLVSYVRARSEGLGMDCEVGLFTRAERVIILTLGMMLTAWNGKAMLATLGVLTAFAAVTVMQRLVHVGRQSSQDA
ncbi:MAG: CDP-alcohol phosphatidyltransferase family protein [Chloroflexi bacterium]|nr:CDP-alcohol phosphatidyltransferase family protein [Chloroflexota bacterium]